MSFTNWIITTWNRIKPQRWGDGTIFYPMKPGAVWGQIDPLEAFCSIPEVNAVINRKAALKSNGRLRVVNDKGETIKNHKLNQVLAKPNWFQAQKEFIRQCDLFHSIWGNEYLYKLTPLGMYDNIISLYTLPPNLVDVKLVGNDFFWQYNEKPTPDQIKYTIRANGKQITLDSRNVVHMNDNRVAYDETNINDFMKGTPKLISQSAACNNLKWAYESRGVILKHRGALGILSNSSADTVGPVPVKQEERERIQTEYARGYGGLEGQSQLIITSANLKWQQMSISPDKLGLFEETEESFNKILDAFGMPSELFVRQKGSTYANQREARKGAYVETIMPEAAEWTGSLNEELGLDGEKEQIVLDYLHLPIFQEDLKYRADTIAITVNAMSKALSDGVISLEDYKKELVKFGIGKSL